MSEKSSFHTIVGPTEGLYKEKGSKFISKAFPIHSEEEIKNLLLTIRKEFYDARHICYAYILHYPSRTERCNDDGEPSYTAGVPILQQIKHFGLENILVVVIRYFGGVKLGTGGLMHAYKTSAEEALKQASILTIHPRDHYVITFPYDLTGPVMRWIREARGEIIREQKTEQYAIFFHTPTGQESVLEEKIKPYGQKITLLLMDEKP